MPMPEMDIVGLMAEYSKKRRYGPPPPAIAEAIKEVMKSRATGLPSARVVARVTSLLTDPHPKDLSAKDVSLATVVDHDLCRWRDAICDDDASNIHRMVFVRAFANGLATDITAETLSPVFAQYGPIEECRIAVDKTTGCSRGLAYLLFQTADAARQAVKEPIKMIANTSTYSQLPYSAPYPTYSGRSHPADTVVYIHNCPDVPSYYPQRSLRSLLEEFGKLVHFPIPHHVPNGGFVALYSNADDAKEAVKDSCKMLGQYQVHCSLTPHASLEALEKTVMDKVVAACPDDNGEYPANKVVYFSHQVSLYGDEDPLMGAKVKEFFAQFGEIAAGPVEVYADGHMWRFSCFVYKTQEGAETAVHDPDKVAEGYNLHCDLTVGALLNAAHESLQDIVKDALKTVVRNQERAAHSAAVVASSSSVAAARQTAMDNQLPSSSQGYGQALVL